MSEDDIGCFVVVVLIFGFLCFVAGFLIGENEASKNTRQQLCKEFTKTPYEYINCNTKTMDEIIKVIKENKQ